jgi:S-adenosylmethionine synthetase
MASITLATWHPVDGLFTSESVSDGHPDKICDQISDAVLDSCLAQDPHSRVAVEAAIKDDDVFVLGELTTRAEIDVGAIVSDVLTGIGHADERWGVDVRRLTVHTRLGRQSPEIAAGVDGMGELGAGDQGMMFGFACVDTPERMPLPIALAHRLMRRHRVVRRSSVGAALGPDAKSQVTVRYEAGRPAGLDTVVLSTQHAPDLGLAGLRELVIEEIIRPCLANHRLDGCRILVNPAGTFHQGGPVADAGLTGRKIIVDTYGGFARHGGGAFSGKDPTKVDRSAAYADRHLAGSKAEGEVGNRSGVDQKKC